MHPSCFVVYRIVLHLNEVRSAEIGPTCLLYFSCAIHIEISGGVAEPHESAVATDSALRASSEQARHSSPIGNSDRLICHALLCDITAPRGLTHSNYAYHRLSIMMHFTSVARSTISCLSWFAWRPIVIGLNLSTVPSSRQRCHLCRLLG